MSDLRFSHRPICRRRLVSARLLGRVSVLENIYSKRDLFRMGIGEFESFSAKIEKILASLEDFCESIEFENCKSNIEGVRNEEVDQIVAEIKRIQTSVNAKTDEKDELTKKQVLGYLYKKASIS